VLSRAAEGIPRQRLEAEYRKLERAARRDLKREGWQGTVDCRRTLDVRYRGQGYELNVLFTASWLEAFHQEHRRRYGYCHPEREVEVVTLRLRARIASPRPPAARAQAGKRGPDAAPRAPVLFDGRRRPTPIRERTQLVPEKLYTGPAVVTEYSATTVVPPGMRFRLDRAGNLVIEIS